MRLYYAAESRDIDPNFSEQRLRDRRAQHCKPIVRARARAVVAEVALRSSDTCGRSAACLSSIFLGFQKPADHALHATYSIVCPSSHDVRVHCQPSAALHPSC